MKLLLSGFLISGIIMMSGYTQAQESYVEKTVVGNLSFCMDLYRQLLSTDGNIFFSPYSISAALAMTYAGAKGKTEQQMAKTLYFDMPPDRLHRGMAAVKETITEAAQKSGYDFFISNTVWSQKDFPILKTFQDVLLTYYHSQIYPVDFRNDADNVRIQINAHVSKQTKEKIKDLLKPPDVTALTRLILTNAIYFKGLWESQFKASQTADTDFFLGNGSKISVPMMHQKGNFGYLETDSLQVLELPYTGQAMSMIILLPKKTKKLSNLDSIITADKINQWTPMHQRQVIVYLPKFKISSQFRLETVLSAMGMKDAFSLPPADFSGISGKKELFISSVIHQAFVDVNEQGSEAAAATAVVMTRAASIPEQPPVFRADHPFIFFIKDNTTGTVIFFGRIVNPKSG